MKIREGSPVPSYLLTATAETIRCWLLGYLAATGKDPDAEGWQFRDERSNGIGWCGYCSAGNIQAAVGMSSRRMLLPE